MKKRTRSRYNLRTIGIAFAVLLAIVIIIALLIPKNAPDSSSNPPYKTITPGGVKSQKWSRLTPSEGIDAYTYNDSIKGKSINVTQQALPDSFKESLNERIAELASGYDKKIVIDGTIIYIGTSAKGPQSVVFSKNDLLVFMKSKEVIEEKDWRQYIQSLR